MASYRQPSDATILLVLRPPTRQRQLALAAARIPPAPPVGARRHARDVNGRSRDLDRDPAGDQGADRRADQRRRRLRAGAARPARPRPGRARGGADLLAALGPVQCGAPDGDRDAPRPLRAPPAAADELPHQVGVGAAALPGDHRPVRDPAVRRIRAALPDHQHPPAHSGHRSAAPHVLAARPGRGPHRRADRVAVHAIREGLRRAVAARAGRAGRPRHPRRRGRGRHPGDQGLRPQRPRLASIRRRGDQAAGHKHGQGPAVGEVLDLPRGDPQPRRGRRTAARRHRRRQRRADDRASWSPSSR